MSERTGLSVSQVTDEVLYTGLVGMQEIDELRSEGGEAQYIGYGNALYYQPLIHKVASPIYMPRCFIRWHHSQTSSFCATGVEHYKKDVTTIPITPQISIPIQSSID